MDKLRHRDLLLSLKYSTIEACFSVPMLNLTLPSFPFVVAFAVKELHWGNSAVGWTTALPHLCNCAQPLLMVLLVRRFSALQILALAFIFGALPWGFAGFLPWLEAFRNPAFAGILLVATLANSIGSVSWSAAMSELVPPRISGRYYGRRNLIFGIWTLFVVLAAGYAVGHSTTPLAAFGLLFALAGMARLIGLLFLNRMKFPPRVLEPQANAFTLADGFTVLRDRNFFRFMLFIGLWGLMLNAGLSFYTVFLVDRLQLGIADVVWFTTLASVGGLLTLKGWGRLCHQHGNRPVLHLCALVWALTALAMWAFAGPRWQWHLNLGYFIVGAVTAGFQLCQFNLMLKLAPAQNRTAYVAVFLAFTSLLTALGPVVGGYALMWLPPVAGELFGQPITGFHLLFAVSGLGCLAATGLAARVREPDAQPLENVWRAMRGMPAFNPMLSVVSAGQLLLTPRGLMALGRRSLRGAKQQVRILGDVGGEIVEGSRDAIRRRIPPQD